MCYYYSHKCAKRIAHAHPWSLQRVQSYLVLRLHARKRQATNKQKTRAQSRQTNNRVRSCRKTYICSSINLWSC